MFALSSAGHFRGDRRLSLSLKIRIEILRGAHVGSIFKGHADYNRYRSGRVVGAKRYQASRRRERNTKSYDMRLLQ
jgi:hypothetical protein